MISLWVCPGIRGPLNSHIYLLSLAICQKIIKNKCKSIFFLFWQQLRTNFFFLNFTWPDFKVHQVIYSGLMVWHQCQMMQVFPTFDTDLLLLDTFNLDCVKLHELTTWYKQCSEIWLFVLLKAYLTSDQLITKSWKINKKLI